MAMLHLRAVDRETNSLTVWALTALAALVAVFLQVGVNFANDYSDGIRGTDANRTGPQRLTASGQVEPKKVRLFAFVFFGLAALAAAQSPRASSIAGGENETLMPVIHETLIPVVTHETADEQVSQHHMLHLAQRLRRSPLLRPDPRRRPRPY
jgi:hypothetical protein